MPTWKDLLSDLVDRLPPGPARTALRAWLDPPPKQLPSRDLEAIAERIHRALGPRFDAELRSVLDARAALTGAPRDTVHRRQRWLETIPFRGVLTTNFDPLLRGEIPGPKAYGQFLTERRSPWWSQRFWANRPGRHTLPPSSSSMETCRARAIPRSSSPPASTGD